MTKIQLHPKNEPWVYAAIRKVIGSEPRTGVLTYGNTIFSIDENLPPDTLEHEMVHVSQQEKKGKIVWWARYLTSKEFRMQQELEAYRHQYAFILSIERDRNIRAVALKNLATSMSSAHYGSIVSYREAHQLISEGVDR